MSESGRYRKVYSNEWHTAAFQSLSDPERVVYFYVRTGPQSNSVGIYRLSTALAAEDLGNMTPLEFDQRLFAVVEAFGWSFDASTRVLWLTDWLDANPPQSPNVCVNWRKLIDNLPNCDLKLAAAAAIVDRLKAMPKAFEEAFGGLPKDSRISKAKPKAQPKPLPKAKPESYQGSGTQRSLDSGNSEKSGPRTTKTNGQPTKLDAIVREALRHCSRTDDIETKLDHVRFFASSNGLDVKRQDILEALARVGASA